MNSGPAPDESILRSALSQIYATPEALDAAIRKLQSSAQTPESGVIDGVDLDLHRSQRCGFPEVVFGEGKPVEMIMQILQTQQQVGQESLVTRIRPEYAAELKNRFPNAIHNPVARTFRLNSSTAAPVDPTAKVYVVTAGSSDRPVAEEALETLLWMHVSAELIMDVGVAGPHRLQRHVARLQQATVIVCVAGMEAALPSVVGGYVPCPVIGVPTSVGYGASLQGLTAMLAMLTCCASNVACVNIDAGFKGGYMAGLIATQASRMNSARTTDR